MTLPFQDGGMGDLADGNAFPEVGTLRRDHLRGMKSSGWDLLGLRGCEISRRECLVGS